MLTWHHNANTTSDIPWQNSTPAVITINLTNTTNNDNIKVREGAGSVSNSATGGESGSGCHLGPLE